MSEQNRVSNRDSSPKIQPLAELKKNPPPRIEYLVEGLLTVDGTTLLAGAPKAGKSTFTRQLAAAVSLGEPFLGMNTKKGTVLIVALEEHLGEMVYQLSLLKHDDASLFVQTERCENIEALESFLESSEASKFDLIIFDPLVEALFLTDLMEYGQTYSDLRLISDFASRTRTQVLVTHHLNKAADRSLNGQVLGSTALTGKFQRTIYLTNGDGGTQTRLHSTGRYGDRITDVALNFSKDDYTFSITETPAESPARESAKDLIEKQIRELLIQNGPMKRQDIISACPGKGMTKYRVLEELRTAGLVTRTGLGNANDPQIFTWAGPKSAHPEGNRDQGIDPALAVNNGAEDQLGEGK